MIVTAITSTKNTDSTHGCCSRLSQNKTYIILFPLHPVMQQQQRTETIINLMSDKNVPNSVNQSTQVNV